MRPIAVSTDRIRPAERHAFWTEAICRSFANVETRPLGSATVSGHFEFVEIGKAKLVHFDSSPQCYSRDARMVSKAGSDEFMFDFQRRGRSSMVQAGSESTIEPGFGVLYDARRPFEDRLYGPGQRSEVFIATVPAAALLHLVPDAERALRQTNSLVGSSGPLDRCVVPQCGDDAGRRPGRGTSGRRCLSCSPAEACCGRFAWAWP